MFPSRRKRLVAEFVSEVFWQLVIVSFLLAIKAALGWDDFVLDITSVLPIRLGLGIGFGLPVGLVGGIEGSLEAKRKNLSIDNPEQPEMHAKIKWIDRPSSLLTCTMLFALLVIPCFAVVSHSQLGLPGMLSRAINDFFSVWSFGMGISTGVIFVRVVRR